MILASFELLFTAPGGGRSCDDIFIVDMDFRSLYQINPDHLIVLKYASMIAQVNRFDGIPQTDGQISMAALVGNFNETRNVVATPAVPADTVINIFDGITFSSLIPFRAHPEDRILMPSTFEVFIKCGNDKSIALGDNMRAWFTIGYDIDLNGKQF